MPPSAKRSTRLGVSCFAVALSFVSWATTSIDGPSPLMLAAVTVATTEKQGLLLTWAMGMPLSAFHDIHESTLLLRVERRR